MTDCGKCGDCCRAIPLALTKKGLSTAYNPDFVLKHWHRISRAEARRRIPRMNGLKGTYYYECDMFDSEENLCTAHDTRPDVCRGFPWYSGNPEIVSLQPFPRCTFWHDVPPADRPDYVQLTVIK